MKILHTVESYNPDVSGMSEVVGQISTALVAMGHDVTVACSAREHRTDFEVGGVKIIQFKIRGQYACGITGVDMAQYQDYVLNSDFDIITNFAAQQWATDLLLPILPKISAAKVFVPTGFSKFYANEFKEYFDKLKGWMKEYDANIFLSDDYRDINFARENNMKKITLIPNGASEIEFTQNVGINIREKYNICVDNYLTIHVGSHTEVKGHKEAIDIFVKSKIKNSTLVIIGNNSSKRCINNCNTSMNKHNESTLFKNKNMRILILNIDREETVAFYQTADLFLFPSNIECSPIVLFEAMASKTPFLVTDVGNSKEIISWSEGGILLPTIPYKKKFSLSRRIFTKKKKLDRIRDNFKGYVKADISKSVQIFREFANNKEARRLLADTGYNAWKERFTWGKISKQYESLYKSLLENK